MRLVFASFLIFAMLLVSRGVNADTIYRITLPPGVGGEDVSVSGTLTTDDNNTTLGSRDIGAYSITVSGICGGYVSCSETMTASNSMLSCNDCLVRSGSDLFIALNQGAELNIASNADNCGPSSNQFCGQVMAFPQVGAHDIEYDYGVCSSGGAGNSVCDQAFDGLTSLSDGLVVAQAISAPEIDPASAVSGLTLLLGGLVVLRSCESRPRRANR